MIVAGAVFAASTLAIGPGSTRDARAVLLDGTTVIGEWLGSPDGRRVELRTPTGPRRIAFDDLSAIVLPAKTTTSEGTTVFHLGDGGHLRGDIASGAEDAVVGRTILGQRITMPFDRLAAVQFVDDGEFHRSAEIFQEMLLNPPPAEDVLVTRSADDAKAIRGRLVRLDATHGSFVFGERTRTVRTENLFGVIFAAGVTTRRSYPVSIQLADGSLISGRLERADLQVLHVETSLGSTVQLPIGIITRITVHSARVVYLGDLPTATQQVEGRLHRPWLPRQDQSVSGGPLSIAGSRFARGLGVHSRTELTYDIDGAYEKFLATIGLDDAVRPLGSVVFRVLGNGRILLDSGEVTGSDEPREVIVDVSDVRRLTLLVDFGAALDLSDHADWGDARLLRPAGYLPTR